MEKLKGLTDEETRFVIDAGLEVLQYTRTLGEGKEIQSIKSSYESQIESLKRVLQTERETIKQQEEQSSRSQFEWKREREQIHRCHETELQSLQSRIRELQRQMQEKEGATMQMAFKQMETQKESLVQPYRESIRTLQENARVWQEQNQANHRRIESLQREIRESNEKLQLFSKSQKRGEAGERNIFDLLQSHPNLGRSGWDIQDTSKTGGKGDIQVIPPDASNVGSVLCEVKLWDSTVSRDEVMKFQRDVMQSDVGSGIFISLHTSIAGKRSGHIEYVSCEEGDTLVWKPVIYLVGQEESQTIPTWILLFSKLMRKIEGELCKMREVETNGVERGFVQEKLKTILAIAEPMMEQIRGMRKTLMEQTQSLEATLSSLVETLVVFGEDVGVSLQTKRRVKSVNTEKQMMESFLRENPSEVQVGKYIMDYLKSRGVSQTKAERLRREYFTKITSSTPKYSEIIGNRPVGKVYWVLKNPTKFE